MSEARHFWRAKEEVVQAGQDEVFFKAANPSFVNKLKSETGVRLKITKKVPSSEPIPELMFDLPRNLEPENSGGAVQLKTETVDFEDQIQRKLDLRKVQQVLDNKNFSTLDRAIIQLFMNGENLEDIGQKIAIFTKGQKAITRERVRQRLGKSIRRIKFFIENPTTPVPQPQFKVDSKPKGFPPLGGIRFISEFQNNLTGAETKRIAEALFILVRVSLLSILEEKYSEIKVKKLVHQSLKNDAFISYEEREFLKKSLILGSTKFRSHKEATDMQMKNLIKDAVINYVVKKYDSKG